MPDNMHQEVVDELASFVQKDKTLRFQALKNMEVLLGHKSGVRDPRLANLAALIKLQQHGSTEGASGRV